MVDGNICLKTPLGEIFLSSQWGSLIEDHRKSIRTELYKKTKNADFLDLDKTPGVNLKPEKLFVSISHCKPLGGYALHLTKKIGFDVEAESRITDKVIEKISSEKDEILFNQESLKFLWVVKEAAYKFASESVDVMTDVQINTLDKVGAHSYLGTLLVGDQTADFLCGEVGEGCVFALVRAS